MKKACCILLALIFVLLTGCRLYPPEIPEPTEQNAALPSETGSAETPTDGPMDSDEPSNTEAFDTEAPTETPSVSPTEGQTETELPEATETPYLTEVSAATDTPAPDETPAPNDTAAPTDAPTSGPTQTPTQEPTQTPASTGSTTPAPTQTPTAAPTPAPTYTPAPTHTPYSTSTPAGTNTPKPTNIPKPTNTPKPTYTPKPTATPAASNLYKCRTNELQLRSEPDLGSSVVGTLHFEETVTYLGAVDDIFVKVKYRNRECYCIGFYLVPANETLYGYYPPQYQYQLDDNGNIMYDDYGNPITLKAELIDIRLVVPNVVIYQIFGTPNNFTGQVLYQRSVPVLQRDTANKLAEAARRFAQDGYRIKIYDCYRPKSVQFILYDIVHNSSYIANPYNSASNHNRAAAVDMVLIDSNGNELDFPTPMHTFNSLANRTSSDRWTAEQRRNVKYMTDIMVECGFKIINSEWWHFSDTNYHNYIVLDIDMRDIPMYTARQLGYGN